MKKNVTQKISLLIISLFLLFTFFLSACFKPNVDESRNNFTVSYWILDEWGASGEHLGTIVGEEVQDVKKGEDATAVTVVPNIGYKFICWEDTGSTNPTRTDYNVQDDFVAIARVESTAVELNFSAGTKGGTLQGDLYQRILYNGNGTPVEAVPEKDFRFVQWSDGYTNPIRENKGITENGYFTAQFERYQRVFKFNYNGATSGNTQTEAVIELDKMKSGTLPNLPVPKREGYKFKGWYSDWHHSVQVSDENGKIIADRQWLDNDYIYTLINPEGNLYAKWQSVNPVPTYKILLIFVTEIDAVLQDRYDNDILVQYHMTETEKRVCLKIASLMEEFLEAILNGTVNFEVDTYFTTQVMRTENFTRGSTVLAEGGPLLPEYMILVEAGQIPEVMDIVNNYGSVLTSFTMNDFHNKLHVTAGTAGAKYGKIHLEGLYWLSKGGGDYNFDNFSDVNTRSTFKIWEAEMESYLHEFTHTIEPRLGLLHNVGVYYSKKYGPIHTEFEYICDYLCGRFEMDGQMVGIPYEFWLNYI